MENPSFARRLFWVVVVASAVVVAWRLVDLFVLLFGAVVVATALHMLAAQLERVRVPARACVPLAMFSVLAVFGLTGWAVGDPLAEQLHRLQERLPASVETVLLWLDERALGRVLLDMWEAARAEAPSWTRLLGFAGLTLGALGSVVLMVVTGIYMALDPRLYHGGVLRLLPPEHRPAVDEALRASADGLRRWLRGQALSMLFVGTTTALGLWWLDIPLALAVGLVSGLMAFIPFVGAIGGGLLAVLLAFLEGPKAALHVLILVIAIQQIEGHVVAPLVQKWSVQLPPVLGLVAAVVFGVLFGLTGVFLAAPMMVVAMILVRTLYVERQLEAAPVPPPR